MLKQGACPFPSQATSLLGLQRLPKPVAACLEILGTRRGAGISVFQPLPFRTKTPAGKGCPRGVEIPLGCVASISRGSYFLALLHRSARVKGSRGRGMAQTCVSRPSLA